MLLPALGRPHVLALAPLRFPLAFLHGAFFAAPTSACRRCRPPALGRCPACTFSGSSPCGACERLALPAYGSALAGFLREHEVEIQREHKRRQQNTTPSTRPGMPSSISVAQRLAPVGRPPAGSMVAMAQPQAVPRCAILSVEGTAISLRSLGSRPSSRC
jgi:hypothetical protein